MSIHDDHIGDAIGALAAFQQAIGADSVLCVGLSLEVESDSGPAEFTQKFLHPAVVADLQRDAEEAEFLETEWQDRVRLREGNGAA